MPSSRARTRHRLFAAFAAAIAMLVGLLVAPAAQGADGTATLTWNVRGVNGVDLNATAWIEVRRDGTRIATAFSHAGQHSITGLTPGYYEIVVKNVGERNRYTPVWGDGSQGVRQESLNRLVSGTNRIDVTLSQGGFIAGTVKGDRRYVMSDLALVAMDPVIQEWSRGAGFEQPLWLYYWEIESIALPPGRYAIVASPHDAQWAKTDHNSVKTSTPTAPYIVVEPGKTSHVDIALQPRGVISGTMTVDGGDGTRLPVTWGRVVVENVDSGEKKTGFANAEGVYAIQGLSGRYRVRFFGTEDVPAIPEYWGSTQDPSAAQIVTADADGVVTGIDADLAMGGSISFWPSFSPAPGRPLIRAEDELMEVAFERLDEETGEYAPARAGDDWDYGWGRSGVFGSFEPGTYRVSAAALHIDGRADDPATPRPVFFGERDQVVVRPGQSTDIGELLLDTDYYGSPPPGGFGPAPTEAGSFGALRPARLLDTRSLVGTWRNSLGPYETITFRSTGRGGVPEGRIASTVLNLTVTNPTAEGFITAYAWGTTQPTASNLNFTRGQTVANLAVVKLDSDTISLTNNSAGTVQLIADVAGYHVGSTPTRPGTFASLDPTRLLDTRVGNGAPAVAVGPNKTVELQVAGRGGIPSSGVSSVVMNVTATNPTAGGFLTAYPAGTRQPTASNVNFSRGQTVPNLTTVKVGANGRVAFTNNSAGTVHVLADAAGYYLAGVPSVNGAFASLEPTRILDTRIGLGAPVALRPNESVDLQVTGRGGVPATGVASAVMNVTVTSPTAGGFITAYPSGAEPPEASNLNFSPGQTVPNLTAVKVGGGGRVTLTNNSAGSVHLIADVAGYHLSGTGTGGQQ